MSRSPESSAETSKFSLVIAATDGREQSDGAIRAGALFGERVGAWRVVSAAPLVYNFTPELDLAMTTGAIEALREQQRVAAELQIRRVIGHSVYVDIDIATGNPAEVVSGIAAQHDASLIVSGLGRHKVVDRLFGDETALAIIRASDKPVLAVPQDFAHVPRSVVVGIDFSGVSTHAATTSCSSSMAAQRFTS